MSRPRTKVRWTEADRDILTRMWPQRHEVDVWQALERRYTLIAVRAQARLLRLKKSQEYRHRCRRSLAMIELYESQERVKALEEKVLKLEAFNGIEKIRELLTIQKCLQDKVHALERQILRMGASR